MSHAARLPWSLLLAGLAGLATACGDRSGDDDDDDTGASLGCFFQGTATGGLDLELDLDAEVGCAGSGSGDAVGLSWGTDADHAVLLWINQGVDVGQTSQSNLAATVALLDNSTFEQWSSASDGCTVDLTDIAPDPDWEGSWIFTGEGVCEGALTSDGEGGDASLAAFSFRGGAPL